MSEMKHPPPQQEPWQAAEDAERRTALRETLYGSATRQMLAAAAIKPGDHVLDIAAGTGDQSRMAARLVGPTGSVLATDISPEMLAVAARFAEQEGLRMITTRAMNAEQLDLPENSYDAVISRLGLMLIPNQQRALTEIRRVLKPGGRLAALVWSTSEGNPLFTLDTTIMANYLGEAAEQRDDAFSLADVAVFASALTEAGLHQVQVEPVALTTFSFPSFEVLANWWGSSLEQALAQLEPEARQRARAEIRQAVRPFEGPHGIQAPAEVLLGAGMKEC